MKFFEFTIIMFLALFALPNNSQAWEYNYSTIVPSSPTVQMNDWWWKDTLCGDKGYDKICYGGPNSATARGYDFDINRPGRAEECVKVSNGYGNYCHGINSDNSFGHLTSHLSYKYSCYYQAFSFVKDAATPIQPLTSNLNTVKAAISGITEDKLRTVTNVGMLPSDNNSWAFTHNTDVAAGTSAMQGLLWAWRSVSNKWEGIWSQAQYPGDDPKERESLPNKQNSKHIIIISDGGDTDGIQNYRYRTAKGEFSGKPNMVDMVDKSDDKKYGPFYRRSEYGFSPGSENSQSTIMDFGGDLGVTYRYYPFYESAEQAFDTCDAHVPQESIPFARGNGVFDGDYAFKKGIDQEGYEEVCNVLAEQGIKVHTVLYGYGDGLSADNDRLLHCSDITKGLSFKNVSPLELQGKLEEIFLFASRNKIKLIN